jgi:hypothetical protein
VSGGFHEALDIMAAQTPAEQDQMAGLFGEMLHVMDDYADDEIVNVGPVLAMLDRQMGNPEQDGPALMTAGEWRERITMALAALREVPSGPLMLIDGSRRRV